MPTWTRGRLRTHGLSLGTIMILCHSDTNSFAVGLIADMFYAKKSSAMMIYRMRCMFY